MPSLQELEQRLIQLDGRGYPAYKDIRGTYDNAAGQILVDHVQGDPFAAPSRFRLRMPLSETSIASDLTATPRQCIALRDFLARRFARACRQGHAQSRTTQGSGKSSRIEMPIPGQQILERSAIMLESQFLEARFTVGLPARGRRILGREAARLLATTLPELARKALCLDEEGLKALHQHQETLQTAEHLRASLADHGLVAFVANGACLPRASGVSDQPLAGPDRVSFRSPESLQVSLNLPNGQAIKGMGIRQGVTLIVGGGFHGKSTLLQALERGVYNHIPGDGREQVVTDASAVKIRAEEGRRIERVNLEPFIRHLPGSSEARHFCTDNASGSTSQAANIVEAVEAGTRLLLMDEDTCATNLLIRDARMQRLVETDGEPITPYVDRVQPLAQRGLSTVLVLGGSGDYFDVADTVIRMKDYQACDVTEEAHRVASEHGTGRQTEQDLMPEAFQSRRIPLPASLDPSKGRREVSIRTRALRSVQFGTEEIDVSQVTQLVDEGQLRAIGRALDLARRQFMDGNQADLPALLDGVMDLLQSEGLDALDDRLSGDYVAFRRFELAATLNRLRTLRIRE